MPGCWRRGGSGGGEGSSNRSCRNVGSGSTFLCQLAFHSLLAPHSWLQAGDWYPAGLSSTDFRGLYGYKMSCCAACQACLSCTLHATCRRSQLPIVQPHCAALMVMLGQCLRAGVSDPCHLQGLRQPRSSASLTLPPAPPNPALPARVPVHRHHACGWSVHRHQGAQLTGEEGWLYGDAVALSKPAASCRQLGARKSLPPCLPRFHSGASRCC